MSTNESFNNLLDNIINQHKRRKIYIIQNYPILKEVNIVQRSLKKMILH